MSTGETLLVLGALVIFSVTALFLNEVLLESTQTLTESQLIAGAVSAGVSAVEKAKSLSFDEAVVQDSLLTNPTQLTEPGNFGSETGEPPDTFDDLDDIHLYIDSTVTLPVRYYVKTIVAYFDTSIMRTTVQKTFFKQLDVLVYTPFLRDTVHLEYLFGNWKQR